MQITMFEINKTSSLVQLTYVLDSKDISINIHVLTAFMYVEITNSYTDSVCGPRLEFQVQ